MKAFGMVNSGKPVDALREVGLLFVLAVLYAVMKSPVGNAW